MTLPVVLDADGLDALANPAPPSAFRALLREALDRGRDVLGLGPGRPISRTRTWWPSARAEGAAW